jgi:hypothetical protein
MSVKTGALPARGEFSVIRVDERCLSPAIAPERSWSAGAIRGPDLLALQWFVGKESRA